MRPHIVIPMGDAAGVGPEIILKALADPETAASVRCLVIGSGRVLERAMDYPGMPRLRLNRVPSPDRGLYTSGVLDLMDLDNISMDRFEIGRVSAMCGRAAYDCIAKAIELAMEGRTDAVVTPPINKESLTAAGVPYIGHTEIFGALTGTADPLTLFEVRSLRIFFLTRHVSLRQACGLVTKDRIVSYAIRCTEALRKLGIREGTMAVAGLNPHSGEHGLFGREQLDLMLDAAEKGCSELIAAQKAALGW